MTSRTKRFFKELLIQIMLSWPLSMFLLAAWDLAPSLGGIAALFSVNVLTAWLLSRYLHDK